MNSNLFLKLNLHSIREVLVGKRRKILHSMFSVEGEGDELFRFLRWNGISKQDNPIPAKSSFKYVFVFQFKLTLNILINVIEEKRTSV